jgi:hypothetical protein
MSSVSVQNVPNKVVIVACPVSKGEVRHVAGVGVLMAIRFIEKSEQFDSGDHSALQFLLDPDQALAIGEALKRSVQTLELGKTLRKSLRKSRNKTAKEPPMLLQAPKSNEPTASTESADALESAGFNISAVCEETALAVAVNA